MDSLVIMKTENQHVDHLIEKLVYSAKKKKKLMGNIASDEKGKGEHAHSFQPRKLFEKQECGDTSNSNIANQPIAIGNMKEEYQELTS